MTGRVLNFPPILAAGLRPPRARARIPAGVRAPEAAESPLDPREAARFRELLLPYLDDAYAFARFLVRDPTLAEDLTQDAYLRAYRGFHGYRGGDPKAWLFAIVRSSVHTWARGRTSRTEAAGDLAADEVADEADSPEAQLIRDADDAALRHAVDALPDPFREALVLRELQEMSYRQISDITGAPIGTVMSRLARARRLLTQALGGRP